MAYQDILYEERGTAAWITINRPKRGNSFRRETLDEIAQALMVAGDASGIRSVVLTAAGNRFFCTGGDVGDYHERYRDNMKGMRAYERAMERTFMEMIHCPKPIINRVQGDVVGGANAFHLASDLVVMSTTAKLQQVGTMVGSVACFGPTQWWPLTIGDKRARDVILCCKPVTAEMALAWGAANAIATPENLDAEVQKYVDTLSKAFPDAMRYSKTSMNGPKELAFREISQGREWSSMHFPSMEARSGFGAFFNKTPFNSDDSWNAIDTGHVTVAPYGGYSVTCASCGAKHLPEDFTFCGKCGKSVQASAGAT
jgi:enoyl-CoA hydratase/carnithine racemase